MILNRIGSGSVKKKQLDLGFVSIEEQDPDLDLEPEPDYIVDGDDTGDWFSINSL